MLTFYLNIAEGGAFFLDRNPPAFYRHNKIIIHTEIGLTAV